MKTVNQGGQNDCQQKLVNKQGHHVTQ